MKWTSTSGNNTTEFKSPEPGTYAAVCYRVIDLGTQESNFNGEKKFNHKVMISWELSEKMDDGRPYVTSNTFTVSLHEKATLRQFLAGWRGRDFTEEELGGFDPKKLIDQPCLLSLVAGKDPKYVNVKTAAKLPKGMEAPKRVNDALFFSLANFNQATFDKLSENLKEKIRKSPEYMSAVGSTSHPASSGGDLESDLPF